MFTKRAINLLVLTLGLTALAWLIWSVGPAVLFEQLLAVGPAFPLVLLAEALSNTTSTVGWRHSFNPSERPSFRRLLAVSFASLSVAGALPSGQAGEVAKANLLRGEASGPEILSSLMVYNLLHVGTTLACVLLGPLIALGGDAFPRDVIWLTLAVAGVLALLLTGLGIVMAMGVFHRCLRRIGEATLIPWSPSEDLEKRARDVDQRMGRMLKERPGDMALGALGLLAGRAFAVVEIHIILSALGVEGGWSTALMVFSTTAMVNYLLMVLPAREGFLEASTLGVFQLLGLAGADGLSLELTRRLRKIFYQALGVGLMVKLR